MKFWNYIFIVLLLISALSVFAVFQIPDNNFHMIACNVGQGDATLIIYKKTQILVDGGRDNKVLNCLAKYLPFWDRRIELVILTHPDSDHFTGLTEVFKRYKVENYLYNPITISKPEYKVLEKVVGSRHPNALYPYTGQVLGVGMIHLDILNPLGLYETDSKDAENPQEVTDQSSNAFSIVNLVSFGKFRALLTGDMPPGVSDKIADEWISVTVDYIKMSHHGSKNGTTLNLLTALMPKLAVISVGKNNYGHPSPEVTDMLKNLGIKYLRTDESGDIEVVTDGKRWCIKGENLQKN